ncbi:NADH-ubiquinone oxidoreductase B14 subunit-like protein [Thermochaetoides thermophila DSM 1495]|uniref:NADH-ubiquinone oxidoreductase B14 subunit-like protein n=1 Tax=Chaetomium thermophilum (strain DSM 1495 / CBS 144.50 / IMI 039719) TaxID=759272 RepID=G0S4Q3_CHATD|nr:NADH-ubiquinone oxidoreductase B14 subunit-like protein [Thermochaetoides thermophila DSM 1495]EGS20482.1 NADH-ubiquinone oxidoreductase B14 subunit-like protein [Thermochaetoides thermophila DSM 1495]7ZM7_P Chain P, NADH-ubiquinone oxidoreductase B14 subunit-like protein [Thermochaetoides thermophila DSM 1495]7ZMB_P Chain P, NADH-ubiquinone oxidoreductase B14 subunit-like protein [Thermochaetoides thermophila DSM 1495]7ZMG_P Chain P, NADH-ubiquinone oxidoreductase B14 subunit-like protein [
MAVQPTKFAVTVRQSRNWADAKQRVIAAYRAWIRAAPEIQTMYSIPFPVSHIRTRIRQEFERHRYVNKLNVVDVLLQQSNADFQETMNFWRQQSHVMAFFKEEHFRGEKRLPSNFITGFLEGRN